MTSATPKFEPLVKLFRGDPDKVRRMLGIFERVTRSDLQQLDQAYASNDWTTVRGLAHKMRSACMQLGEVEAANALAAVERTLHHASGDDPSAHAFAFARDQLSRVLTRVAEYLAVEE